MRIQDATRYRRLPLRKNRFSWGGSHGDDHLLVCTYFFTTNELM
jgi:hypothetical protein